MASRPLLDVATAAQPHLRTEAANVGEGDQSNGSVGIEDEPSVEDVHIQSVEQDIVTSEQSADDDKADSV